MMAHPFTLIPTCTALPNILASQQEKRASLYALAGLKIVLVALLMTMKSKTTRQTGEALPLAWNRVMGQKTFQWMENSEPNSLEKSRSSVPTVLSPLVGSIIFALIAEAQ